MSDLRSKLIRLAHESGPGEFREAVLPLLKEAAMPSPADTVLSAHALADVLHDTLYYLQSGDEKAVPSVFKVRGSLVRLMKELRSVE